MCLQLSRCSYSVNEKFFSSRQELKFKKCSSIIPEFLTIPEFLIKKNIILLRLFQQHYRYNVTGQSQESEGFL